MRKRPAHTNRYRMREILRVYIEAGGLCSACGLVVEAANATIDHIVPVARGGGHHPDNWQLMHRSCNSHKSDSLPLEIPQRALRDPYLRQLHQELEDLRVRVDRLTAANLILRSDNQRLLTENVRLVTSNTKMHQEAMRRKTVRRRPPSKSAAVPSTRISALTYTSVQSDKLIHLTPDNRRTVCQLLVRPTWRPTAAPTDCAECRFTLATLSQPA